VNLEAVWHDLECGEYEEDLPLWRVLADDADGRVLDIGAGTGRVTLDLARRGIDVIALDVAPPLLEALACRAAGLPVQTLCADARDFALEGRVSLIIAPMQTLQLLGGAAGRAAFLRRALEHLEPEGLLVAALADALDCFDAEHEIPPPAETREILGVRYASQLLAVYDHGDRAAILRRREIIGPQRRYRARDVVIELDRVSAEDVIAEAVPIGFVALPHMYVAESEKYIGATVVALRAPPHAGVKKST
jgi:SAM-dependent methyltransferase